MTVPTLLALDLGTTAAKAAVFDTAGRRIRTFRLGLSLHRLPAGGVEQDPREILDAARELLGRASRAFPRSVSIVSCGIACQRSTLVVWERESGRPIGPAVSWMDRRAAPLVARLVRASGEIARRTGLRLSPHYGAAHLARRLAEDPALARAARRGKIVAGPVASFVLARMVPGSVPACDPTLAQRTLLFDPRRGEWDPRLLALFGIPPGSLPEVRPSAAEWGELVAGGTTFRVQALAGDQQASAAAFDLGSRTASAIVHYGTGAFALWPLAGRLARRAGLLVSVRADVPAAFYAEGTVSTAGAALDAVARWIGKERLRRALARGVAAHSDPGAFLLVPAFAGLGAPHWDPEAQAVLAGGGGGGGPEDLASAALSGIAHRVVDILEAGGATLSPRGSVIMSGPISTLRGFAALQADLLGRPVRIAKEPEATLRGIARIASRSAGGTSIPGAAAGPAIAPRLPARDRREMRERWKRALRASRVR